MIDANVHFFGFCNQLDNSQWLQRLATSEAMQLNGHWCDWIVTSITKTLTTTFSLIVAVNCYFPVRSIQNEPAPFCQAEVVAEEFTHFLCHSVYT